MQKEGTQSDSRSDVLVTLEASEPTVVGLSALATIRVVNRGTSPVTVSSRLNLAEGDLQLLITGPSGKSQKVSGAGGQPDTALRVATLLPGQQIIGSINLLYTSVGLLFSEPGKYTLQAEYYPAANMPPVLSGPVEVTARLPESEDERAMAGLLEPEEVRRALTLVEADAAPDTLKQIATRFPDMREGRLARLILASEAGFEDVASDQNQVSDPLTLALSIRALSTPFSNVGKRLAKQFTSLVENQDKSGTDRESVEKAVKIAKGEPLEID